jgi:hypothetical protein
MILFTALARGLPNNVVTTDYTQRRVSGTQMNKVDLMMKMNAKKDR